MKKHGMEYFHTWLLKARIVPRSRTPQNRVRTARYGMRPLYMKYTIVGYFGAHRALITRMMNLTLGERGVLE